MTWQTSPDAPWEIGTPGDVNATWAVLSVHKSPRTGHKGANTTQALLRFISFADANPDRLVTCNDKSQLRRAADFLAECAGKHANPSSTRLRRAEAEFRSTNIEEALNHLREGVQLRMGISPPIRRGLLRPASESLSDIERNELIYMARASSPELKVLAIRRLSTEYKYSEVRDTLKQMQNSKHAWVRAAAELCTAGQILPPASLRRIGRRLDIPLQASMQVVP
jgi:hypothetical protein